MSTTACTAEELRERFKVLSLQLHPDKQHPSAATSAGNPVAGDAEATSFQRVVQAYSTLKDSVARKHYDAVRLAGGVAQELPVDAEVDLDDLTWDDETGRSVVSAFASGISDLHSPACVPLAQQIHVAMSVLQRVCSDGRAPRGWSDGVWMLWLHLVHSDSLRSGRRRRRRSRAGPIVVKPPIQSWHKARDHLKTGI